MAGSLGGPARRPKVLYLSPDTPAALNGGARIRCAFVARSLHECSELCVWVLKSPLAPADASRADVPWEHWEAPPLADSLPAKLLRHLRGLLFRAPITLDYYVDAERERQIATKLESLAPDVVVLGDSHLGALLPLVRRHAPTARCILDTHNVEWMLFDRLSRSTLSLPERFRHRILADCTLALERYAVTHADEVWAVSDADAREFRALGATSVYTFPNAIDLPAYRPAPLRGSATVSFVGNFGYAPNEEAALFLIEVSRRLRRAGTAHELRIAGRNTTERMRRAARDDSHVRLVGEVESGPAEMLLSDVFAAPLLTGAGAKVKIVEALALGRAVVTTPIGNEGWELVDRREALVCSPARFGEALAEVLESPDLARALGLAGRAWMERHMDPSPIRRGIQERIARGNAGSALARPAEDSP